MAKKSGKRGKASFKRTHAPSSLPSSATVTVGRVVISSDDPHREALERRARERKRWRDERMQVFEKLKEEGNKFFVQGKAGAAAKKYEDIIEEYGVIPAVSNNLAACYLKFEAHAQADEAATDTLIHEPKNLKARYRRAVARKGMGDFGGAIKDFNTVIRHEPSHHLARIGLREAERERDIDGGFDDFPSDEEDEEEDEWPGYNMDPTPIQLDEYSDSEDCRHSGNGTPCRAYNHEGCAKGSECSFEHAPDSASVRDGLGKNVCRNFLVNRCKSGGDECAYSHVRTYLPSDGWWNNPKDITDVQERLQETDSDRDPPLRIRPGIKQPTVVAPPPAELPPFILVMLLDSGDPKDSAPQYYDMLSALNNLMRIIEVSDPQEAISYLASPQLKGVLVADTGITLPENTLVSRKLVDYVKSDRRGIVVFDGNFVRSTPPPELAMHFSKDWDLPWRMSSVRRALYWANMENALGDSVRERSVMNAVNLKGMPKESAVFEDKGARNEAPVIFHRVALGQGYVGYVGDVDVEGEGARAVVAMFSHLQNP